MRRLKQAELPFKGFATQRDRLAKPDVGRFPINPAWGLLQ